MIQTKKLRISPQYRALSHAMQRHVARIESKLTHHMVELLDRERAAFRICRYVAYGKWVPDRAVRLALVMFLRKTPSRKGFKKDMSGWDWPKDFPVTVAERFFRQSPVFQQLAKQGSVLVAGQFHNPGDAASYQLNWTAHWSSITEALDSLDRESFLGSVQAAVKVRRVKRRRRKAVALDARQVALLGAINIVRKAVIDGYLTAEDLPIEVKETACPFSSASATSSRKRSKRPSRT